MKVVTIRRLTAFLFAAAMFAGPFMIGSAISGQADAMIWLGPGETRAAKIWRPGQGQLWPSKSDANGYRLADMLDLHGVCFGGGPMSIFVNLCYTSANDRKRHGAGLAHAIDGCEGEQTNGPLIWQPRGATLSANMEDRRPPHGDDKQTLSSYLIRCLHPTKA